MTTIVNCPCGSEAMIEPVMHTDHKTHFDYVRIRCSRWKVEPCEIGLCTDSHSTVDKAIEEWELLVKVLLAKQMPEVKK